MGTGLVKLGELPDFLANGGQVTVREVTRLRDGRDARVPHHAIASVEKALLKMQSPVSVEFKNSLQASRGFDPGMRGSKELVQAGVRDLYLAEDLGRLDRMELRRTQSAAPRRFQLENELRGIPIVSIVAMPHASALPKLVRLRFDIGLWIFHLDR